MRKYLHSMKLFDFLHEFGDESTIVKTLQDKGLLRMNCTCDHCGDSMKLQRTDTRDRVRFECSKRTCRSRKTIRSGSFFANARISLCECMLLMHLWSKGYSEKLVGDDFSFATQTIVDWFRFCRELCVSHFESRHDVIGGPDSVVEIDETHIVRRKYDRGRALQAGWLVGGIERRTDGQFKAFFVIVYNRSGPLLKHLIQQHVAAGTHIITDGWAGYLGLSDLGYRHSVVIHDENFVSPDDRQIHTQRIESTWGSLKRFIRARGTYKGEFLAEYICEYIFRRQNEDPFEASISEIQRLHKVI